MEMIAAQAKAGRKLRIVQRPKPSNTATSASRANPWRFARVGSSPTLAWGSRRSTVSDKIMVVLSQGYRPYHTGGIVAAGTSLSISGCEKSAGAARTRKYFVFRVAIVLADHSSDHANDRPTPDDPYHGTTPHHDDRSLDHGSCRDRNDGLRRDRHGFGAADEAQACQAGERHRCKDLHSLYSLSRSRPPQVKQPRSSCKFFGQGGATQVNGTRQRVRPAPPGSLSPSRSDGHFTGR